MAIAIPTIEPQRARAGDSWSWRREDLTDYPATTWTLKYRFKSETIGFEITASASGTAFAISVPSATTATYPAGSYNWIAWLTDGVTSTTVRTGLLTVDPDLRAGTAASALDLRTPARLMLDAVTAVLQKTATYEQRRMTWDNRELERHNPADLLKLYDSLKTQVAREELSANSSLSRVDPSTIFIRLERA
jgi:hypothetical protein